MARYFARLINRDNSQQGSQGSAASPFCSQTWPRPPIVFKLAGIRRAFPIIGFWRGLSLCFWFLTTAHREKLYWGLCNPCIHPFAYRRPHTQESSTRNSETVTVWDRSEVRLGFLGYRSTSGKSDWRTRLSGALGKNSVTRSLWRDQVIAVAIAVTFTL